MSYEIVVPELGESIYEATVGRWLKAEGDRLQAAEAVVELETDKVNLEVGSERAGVLAEIRVPEGEDVNVGDVLATVEELPEEETGDRPAAPEGEQQAAAEVQPGDGRPAPDGEPVSTQKRSEQARSAAEPDAAGERQQAAGRAPEVEATPVAQRLASEWQIDLEQVPGTGSGGRVTKGDLEAFRRELEQARGEPAAEPEGAEESDPAGQVEHDAPRERAAAAPPAPAEAAQERREEGRTEERVRMSRRRRTIARVLVEAQREAAILSTFNEIDMSQVMQLRRVHNPRFEQRHGVKLGITSFFVKACVAALKRFPRLNAELQDDELVLKNYYDIGIAIGDERGLVVPVLRSAETMSFAEIELTIDAFVERAASGELTLEELRGGTFSITNGGVYGSLLSTPILNPPQSGILGLHKIEPRPVVIDDQVVVRSMMYVALSYDHRVVDGREAVQFLVAVKELIEQPAAMLLED